MKKILAASLALGALTGVGAAQAADLPLKAPEPLVPVFSWTGWYIGANAGWLRGNANFDPVCPTFDPATCPVLFPGFAFNTFIPGFGNIQTFVPAASGAIPGGSTSGKSFMGGGQIGYNYEVNHVVFGVEGDLDATHIRASLTRGALTPAGAPAGFFGTVTANSNFENDWMGSVRGRVGIAFDRLLLYGTGGLAFAGSRLNTAWVYTPPGNAIPAFNLPGPIGASSTQVLMGWTAGVGGEWAVTDQLSLGAEYRHSDFGSQNYTIGTDVIGGIISENVKYTTDQVTVRANWHFGARNFLP